MANSDFISNMVRYCCTLLNHSCTEKNSSAAAFHTYKQTRVGMPWTSLREFSPRYALYGNHLSRDSVLGGAHSSEAPCGSGKKGTGRQVGAATRQKYTFCKNLCWHEEASCAGGDLSVLADRAKWDQCSESVKPMYQGRGTRTGNTNTKRNLLPGPVSRVRRSDVVYVARSWGAERASPAL